MKKALALLLAAFMLSMTAFAVPVDSWHLPGDKIEIKADTKDYFVWWDEDPAKKLNSENYSLSKVDWEEGKNLVEKVYFDDEENSLVIKLKENYDLSFDPADAAYESWDDIPYLYGTIRIREKGSSNSFTLNIGFEDTASGEKFVAYIAVGYMEMPLGINDDGDAIFFYGARQEGYGASNPVEGIPDAEQMESILWVVSDESDLQNRAFGQLDWDINDNYNLSGRVYEDERLYLGYDESADKDILKANPDAEFIDFLKFNGRPTFTSNVTLEFYNAEEDDFIYEIKDGKLVTPSRLKWDEDAGVWTLTTRTLGSYVVCEEKLATVVEDISNPDTGMDAVAQIAAALAAI